jgi:hypothetical protein
MFNVESQVNTSGMVNGRQKDEEGRFFFDRNHDMFGTILEYLRNGKLTKKLPEDMDSLKAEAVYFGIQSLIDIITDEEEEKRVIFINYYNVAYDANVILNDADSDE